MERKTVSTLMLTMLLIGLLSSALTVEPVESEPTTIIVPDDYPTIQEAVNVSADGDIIVVNAGTYIENVNVNKRLTILGIGFPVVDGNGGESVFTITSDEVNLRGFSVTNASAYSSEPFGGGIELIGVRKCNITGNIVYNNSRNGISLTNSNYIMIEDNVLMNNEDGIRLWSQYPLTSSHNIIHNNTSFDNKRYGIESWSYVYATTTTSNNLMSDNNLYSNNYGGIYVGKSIDNFLLGNNFSFNPTGVSFERVRNTTLENNIVSNNGLGIKIAGYEAHSNEIFHNLFINNTRQTYVGEQNTWDNGYPSGGNYWSDYNGTDSYKGHFQNETGRDLLGDKPYIINPENIDSYPLVFPLVPLRVPFDYPTIQEAINNANEGDTIFVRNGTYYENVVVNKTVSLVGENRDTTVIDGNGTGNVIYVTANDTVIKGFTIQNGLRGVWFDNSHGNTLTVNNIWLCDARGVHLTDSNYNTLTNLTVSDINWAGIWIQGSSNNIVSGNIAINNKYGIRFIGSSHNNTIKGNILISNEVGIHLNSHYNTIIGNNASDNVVGIGIWAWYNNITNNLLSNNKIRIEDSNYNRIYHNNFYGVVVSWHGIIHHDNIWDNGYPSGGNYWSDYNGTDMLSGPFQNETDSDGIGDATYIIDANNTDNYPLMQPYHGPVRNLNTGQSYPTIQGAINNATEGDRIFVLSGVYYENVIVNKTVSLIGENKNTTIIDGNGTGGIISIRADNVSVSRFTMQRGDFGVYIHVGREYVKIEDCIITQIARYGVYTSGSHYHLDVFDNLITNVGYGIFFWNVYYSSIVRNVVSNITEIGIFVRGTASVVNNTVTFATGGLGRGIQLQESGGYAVSGNNISYSTMGMRILWSTGITFRNNHMTGNEYNLYIYGYGPDGYQYSTLDIDTSNTVDGKPIHYLIDQSNLVIDPSTFPDVGYIGIVRSQNITVRNLNLTNNGQGLLFAFTSNSTIENVRVHNNIEGILLVYSHNNTITGNIISDNDNAIYSVGSKDNVIYDNALFSNGYGIRGGISRSRIENNTISNNWIGIRLGLDNLIYHNNFVNNTIQVYSTMSNNTWDNGYEGNYWSDYNGTDLDGDGIGDTYLPWQDVDYYPLMNRYWNPADINHDLKVDIRDIATVAIAFGSYPSHPRWNPMADLNRDNKVDIRDIALIAIHFGETYQ